MPTTTTTSHAFWTEASKTKPKKQRLGYANENHNHGDFIINSCWHYNDIHMDANDDKSKRYGK